MRRSFHSFGAAVAVAVGISLISTESRASLIGDTVNGFVNGVSVGSAVVVDPGLEFNDLFFPGVSSAFFVSADFAATTLTITVTFTAPSGIINVPSGNQVNYTNLNWVDAAGNIIPGAISSVVVDPTSTLPVGLLTTTPSSILVGFNAFSVPGGGGSLFALLNINTTHAEAVPEPATLALFAFGLAGLGFMTRRRRRSAAG